MPFRIGPLELMLLIPLFLVGLVVYFLPAIIAAFRRHPNMLAIFLIDLLLGWTFLAWIGALVWAFILPAASVTTSQNAVEIAKGRYARGEISAAELEEIKKNIS